MDTIINKALEGGYDIENFYTDEQPYSVLMMNPRFWQALGKACDWNYTKRTAPVRHRRDGSEMYEWEFVALDFHQINLIRGWNDAVKWLEELITKK